MSLLVVVLLAALWVAILVPGLLRGRGTRSPMSSIDSFHRSMGILASERMTGGPHAQPWGTSEAWDPDGMPSRRVAQDGAAPAHRPPSAAQRRRRILTVLGAAAALSGGLAVVVGGVFGVVFWLSVVVLAAYVGLLFYLRANALEARTKVRHLPSAGPSTGAQAEQRRAVGSMP